MRLELALILLLLLPSVLAVADIGVDRVEYDSGSGRLVATVLASEDAGDVLFYFFDNGNLAGATRASPSAGVTNAVYIDYQLQPGSHEIKAVADPLNALHESNRANNEASANLLFNSGDVSNVIVASGEGFSFQAVWVFAFAVLAAVIMLSYHWGRGIHSHGEFRSGPGVKYAKEEIYTQEKGAGSGKTDLKESFLPPAPATAAATSTAATAAMAATTSTASTAASGTGAGSEIHIKDISAMPKGTQVTFRASIEFQDKVGSDYAYFLSDDRDQIIGFSKKMISKKDVIIQGVVETFLGENNIVMISSAE